VQNISRSPGFDRSTLGMVRAEAEGRRQQSMTNVQCGSWRWLAANEMEGG